MTEPRESTARIRSVDRGTGLAPETDVVVRFSGEVYEWIIELKEQLADAINEEDVPTIAIELLHHAVGKEIRVGNGTGAQVFNLWR